MEEIRLTRLSDGIAARLSDDALTRYQLIDMATVLMFVQRYLHGKGMVQGGTALHDLEMSLGWMRDHAADAPVPELRARVTTAMDAVDRILGRDVTRPSPQGSRVIS